MPHVIAEPCINTKDTACTTVCPVDCIHPMKGEVEFKKVSQLFIDPDSCIDCGACVSACPVDAIYPLEDLPAHWASFAELNADFFKK